MNDDEPIYNVGISKPVGPRARPCLPRMSSLNYSENALAEEMGGRKKLKNNVRDESMNSTKNSTFNSSTSSVRTPESESRRPRDNRQDRRFAREASSCKSSDNESGSSTPEKSDTCSDSIDSSLYFERTFDRSRSITGESSEHERLSPVVNKSRINLNQNANRNQTENKNNLLSWFIVSILVGFVGYWMLKHLKTTPNFNLKSNIIKLEGLFPSQDQDIWSNFGSGIADVESKRHTPAIFLLLAAHNETANCLARRVAEIARTALKGTGDVILTPEHLMNDINKVFDVMEEQMKRTKVVVVTDVLSIQPEALKAFHDICDQYSSLVDEAVYILIMKPCQRNREPMNLVSCAEQQLKTKFLGKIPKDTLDALIIRLTNGAVLEIKAEQSIPCSE